MSGHEALIPASNSSHRRGLDKAADKLRGNMEPTDYKHVALAQVERLVNDNTRVALALLVAESLPAQKELRMKLVKHFVLLKENG